MKALNWGDIMVIYNTAFAESQTVAEYYATQRGIPSGNVVGYALGTSWIIGAYNELKHPIGSDTERDNFRAGPLTDIRDFCSANNIKGIAVSIRCPDMYTFDDKPLTIDGEGGVASMVFTMCNAASVLAGAPTDAPGTSLPLVESSSRGLQSKVPAENWSAVLDWTYVTPTDPIIFGGKLGKGFEPSLVNDSVALATTCIDDAIWFENNGVPENEPALFGYSFRVAGWMDCAQLYWAHDTLAHKLGQVHTYNGNYNSRPSSFWNDSKYDVPAPEFTIPDAELFLNGTSGAPPIDVWFWVGLGMENVINTLFYPSVTFKRGAFFFESTSGGVGRYGIAHGACATVCPVTEPYANGLPGLTALSHFLGLGFTVAEAVAQSCAGRQTVAYGDPFYSPFISNQIVNNRLRGTILPENVI